MRNNRFAFVCAILIATIAIIILRNKFELSQQNRPPQAANQQQTASADKDIPQPPTPTVNEPPAAPIKDVSQQGGSQGCCDSANTWWLSFLLILVTAGQGFLIWRQNAIMEQQSTIMTGMLQATKDTALAGKKSAEIADLGLTVTQRAYVDMSHQSPGITLTNMPDGQTEIRIKMAIKNGGNTPARVTRVLLHPYISPSPLPEKPPYRESFGENVATFLGSKEGVNLDKNFFALGLAVHMVQHNPGPPFVGNTLWIIGYVDYIDAFDVRHRAGYARRYSPKLHSTKNNLLLENKDDYNYDRKREKNEGEDWPPPPNTGPSPAE